MNRRLPSWFKQEFPDDSVLKVSGILAEHCVDTVCRQAKCPNTARCFKGNRATFLILGNRCTRNCRFCNVNKAGLAGLTVDRDEPRRVSEAVKALGIEYAVVTSVTRDDLQDGGSGIFAETIRLLKNQGNNIKVEALIPDFKGSLSSLKAIVGAGADVIAHNIETVERLSKGLRQFCDYRLSLEVLAKIKGLSPLTPLKSSIMLGLGEMEEEVTEAMRDLRLSRCDILALGQYLAPSPLHYPVKEFISPERFEQYKLEAIGLGFKSVLSGPLVRSSYEAERVYKELSYA